MVLKLTTTLLGKARRYGATFSFVGLVFATLFFAASVTPSLLPRPYYVQGVLSGFAIAIGYGLGVLAFWTWRWLELPELGQAAGQSVIQRRAKIAVTISVLIMCWVFLRQSALWQNSIRELMELPPEQTAYPIRFFAIAVALAIPMIALVRLLILAGLVLKKRIDHFLPRRISGFLSGVIVVFVVVMIANGVVARGLLNLADSFFLATDELFDPDITQPKRSEACGSPDSLVTWPTIGRQGKRFIDSGPKQTEIADWISADSSEASQPGPQAIQPIRVYVGMRSRDDENLRAELAVEELKRVGGFDRKVLIVATPTGTGWLDENAVDPIEFLHRGDTAIISTQYSYLPSWITILVDPDRSKRSAEALFDRVYKVWKNLPDDDRPRLYLFGLSLGSLGSEASQDLREIFEDPIGGAVWSGPPFPSTRWAEVVADRKPDTPIWMPKIRDGRMFRFTNQTNHLEGNKAWGKIRNVYIQHASDPMVWFSPSLAWNRPAWLKEPRGPDVSPYLRWYPIITFLQTAFDLPLATSVPIGYGHNYAPDSYIDAWVAVTDPADWDDADTQRLKAHFESKLDEAEAH